MQAAVESEEEAYPVGNTNGENSMLSADALKSSPIEAKEGISMIEALKSGWHGTPAALAKEVLLGIIICMAQIPESIAFAYMAHVRPPVALHAAWVVGLICATLGGRPGMINGATGAFAAIVSTFLPLPETYGGNGAGIELLFPSVILAGVFMLAVWALNLDRFITMLPLPVMIGFCNGLAIVIGRAQLHPFNAPVCGADGVAASGSSGSLASQRQLAATGECTSTGYKQGAELWFMLLIMFAAMLVMEFLPKLPKPSNLSEKPAWAKPFLVIMLILLELPSSLISIIISIDDALPKPFWTDPQYDLNVISADGAAGTIFTQALLLCAVGCIESLMTAEVVSGFTKTAHHSGLVVGAMGLGNIISGILGGMGGNAMIGLSTIACLNGGKGRVAPLATSLGIVITVAAAYEVLNFIPMAALAGIMIVVVLHTFKWFSVPMLLAAMLPESYRTRFSDSAENLSHSCSVCGRFSMNRKIVRSDVLVMLAVSVLVVLTNIVLAVGIGLGLSCAAFAWESAKRLNIASYTDRDSATKEAVKVYEVDGPLFFAASRRFSESFDVENDPDRCVVLFSAGFVFDYTLMDSLVAVSASYSRVGKRIEFRQLEERSCKMLKKDSYHTKQLVYEQRAVGELQASVTKGAAQYSAQTEARNRAAAGSYGISAPGWSSTPLGGPHDVHEAAPLKEVAVASSSEAGVAVSRA